MTEGGLHLIRSINDPEHPLSLEELNVVEQVRVRVSNLHYVKDWIVLFYTQEFDNILRSLQVILKLNDD